MSLFESHRQAGGLRPKAGGGCVCAWIVCVAVEGAECRGQCCAVLRAIGGRWCVRDRVLRARVRERGAACVSRAGRVRGAAAARSRTSILVHVLLLRLHCLHSTVYTPVQVPIVRL